MKRTELEALGLEKEIIDKIMDINGQDINAAKKDLEAITRERDELKKEVSDRDGQIESLKKSAGNNEDLKKQIETLQAENKATKLNAAIEKALTGAKARNITAVKALLKDIDKAELSDDGTVKGLEDQIKLLKSSDDTKFLFDTETRPAKDNGLKGVTPGNAGDGKPTETTKEQFNKMSYRERVALKQTDPDTYEVLAGHKTAE